MKKANQDHRKVLILSLQNTITGLEYIAESPPQRYGGFHNDTVLTAKSALHHIKRLKGVNREKKRAA